MGKGLGIGQHIFFGALQDFRFIDARQIRHKMQILTEIAFAVFYQAHQTVGTRHGIGAVMEIIGIGKMMALCVGERDGFQQPFGDVRTSLVCGIECRFITLCSNILRQS